MIACEQMYFRFFVYNCKAINQQFVDIVYCQIKTRLLKRLVWWREIA